MTFSLIAKAAYNLFPRDRSLNLKVPRADSKSFTSWQETTVHVFNTSQVGCHSKLDFPRMILSLEGKDLTRSRLEHESRKQIGTGNLILLAI